MTVSLYVKREVAVIAIVLFLSFKGTGFSVVKGRDCGENCIIVPNIRTHQLCFTY